MARLDDTSSGAGDGEEKTLASDRRRSAATKAALLSFEKNLLGWPLVRWPIIGVDRLIRRLLWLWGRMRFGAMIAHRGKGCVCHWNADLKYPQNITLGDGVVIGTNVSIGAHSPVHIGHRVRISRDVVIESATLDFDDARPPYRHISKPITIEDGVWIGTRAVILGGTTIGEHSVIAAGTVVTKPVAPYSIVGGVPAKVIGTVVRSKRDI
jgi:acetyltransferase-like isoleucine patch superfamily enzyme